MKTSFKSMLALVAFGATTLISQAQTAPKILVVDINKALQSHYKAAEQEEKLKAVAAKADQDLGAINKELNDLAAKLKEADEQSKNPAITKDAQTKAQAEVEKISQALQAKQSEGQNFVVSARRQLGELQQNAQNYLIEDIVKNATEVAKRKGATLLLPKGAVVYADASYDITDEVITEINKNKPAGAPAPAAATAAPASTTKPAAVPAAGDTPTVSFPGTKK